VTDMREMFRNSQFDGDIIGKWNIRPNCNTWNMFGEKIPK
jgi:hypothetical protein